MSGERQRDSNVLCRAERRTTMFGVQCQEKCTLCVKPITSPKQFEQQARWSFAIRWAIEALTCHGFGVQLFFSHCLNSNEPDHRGTQLDTVNCHHSTTTGHTQRHATLKQCLLALHVAHLVSGFTRLRTMPCK